MYSSPVMLHDKKAEKFSDLDGKQCVLSLWRQKGKMVIFPTKMWTLKVPMVLLSEIRVCPEMMLLGGNMAL